MKWERLAGGAPLPGSTENSSVLFLEPSEKLFALLSGILDANISYRELFREGCLLVLANGKKTGGKHLCLLTPDWTLVYRSPEAVLRVTPGGVDAKAIEDGRLVWVDDCFYLWYCGYNGQEGRACMAWSRDLLHWEKEAPLGGDLAAEQNKDHVIFPEKIGGQYYLLHRPWGEALFPDRYNMPIRLATAQDLRGGNWKDLGVLLYPQENPDHRDDWLGAGAAPIPLLAGRYLMLYHNAWYEKDGYRQYHLSAAILDFNRGNPELLESLVTHRLESILRPEDDFPNEVNEALRISIVFPMSGWKSGDWLYVAYGAGDKVTCVARVQWNALLAELENHPVQLREERR